LFASDRRVRQASPRAPTHRTQPRCVFGRIAGLDAPYKGDEPPGLSRRPFTSVAQVAQIPLVLLLGGELVGHELLLAGGQRVALLLLVARLLRFRLVPPRLVGRLGEFFGDAVLALVHPLQPRPPLLQPPPLRVPLALELQGVLQLLLQPG